MSEHQNRHISTISHENDSNHEPFHQEKRKPVGCESVDELEFESSQYEFKDVYSSSAKHFFNDNNGSDGQSAETLGAYRNIPSESACVISCQDNDSERHERSTQNSQELMEVTKLRDIIGHNDAKLRIQEVILPLVLPQEIVDSVLTGIRSVPASILLFGPPGCGKV